MVDYFPPIQPHALGMLDVGDGNQMYWEAAGNPDGRPALFLHGGPGSGASPGQRRLFDPKRYLAVLFDQRGSGLSRPLAGEPGASLLTNTTSHLVDDIEALRRHLGVDRWVVTGFSWGTTLGLAYAQSHPERVEALVLGLVTTTSQREVDWATEGVGRLFPEQWHRFSEAIPGELRHLRPVDAYAEMLQGEDPALRAFAAREWCLWEDAHVSLGPGHAPNPRFGDPDFRYRFALLVTHYWRHSGFLAEDQLLREIGRLEGVPGHLIHGRYDVSSPLETAWQLSRHWETSRLTVLEDAGHGSLDSFPAAVMSALAQEASDDRD